MIAFRANTAAVSVDVRVSRLAAMSGVLALIRCDEIMFIVEQ
jgi:hypothetical protein